MFLLTDLSPQNNKVYACVRFPNCFTFLNIYRPIASIMISTGCQNYMPIPTTLLLIALLFSLLRFPLITWRFNRVSQMFMSAIIWSILFSFLELASQQSLSIVSYLVGLPSFALCMEWLLSKRTLSILKEENNSVFKLKMLYYMIINKDSFEE